jgi:hypothetical protein
MEEDIALESNLPKYGALSSGELTPLNGTTPTASRAVTPVPAAAGSSHPMATEAEFDAFHRELRRMTISKEEARKGNTESERSGEKKEDSQKT